ncbi:TRAP transporter, DctM subunit [Palleronia marisminoris]|uniref:TRAP transporter large permease protein n=1 Tax=Palleronia marisminoris TaxID=315423 RepID=A0A1Y5SGW4_9RHOB|nr:TRAP transporter large permease [Palleronia marisminoris]SFG78820.1 TRAP transporter, DctM subunit [Palleronia marisminoris]SLN38807.1 Sialic acid TRAP transporter permease protein SiaT [Palleronia marisminoris]
MSWEFSVTVAVIMMTAFVGLPIGHAMIGASVLYLLMVGQDMSIAGEQMLQGLYGSYVLLAIPLFIFAADLMNVGSLSDRLLDFCRALVGRFRGGLGHVNVVSSLIFSGMSGSAIADAVGMGRIIINLMTKDGKYPAAYAGAITAATAIIGPIIPPSIPMILYALVSDTSIGYLFLGGVGPGLVLGVLLMVMNAFLARLYGFPVDDPVPVRDLPRITLRAVPALLMPVILFAGIYGGVTTPTEAAALAGLYAFLVSAFFYRSISLRMAYQTVKDSARSTASVGILIAGALAFNYVVTVEQVPNAIRGSLADFDLGMIGFLLMINALLLLLGCLLEANTILLVIVPIFLPTALALGIDPVHFGVIVVVNTMLGLVTPPYGLLLFVVSGITRTPIGQTIWHLLPFVAIMIVGLAIITFIPSVVLWLPRLYGYGN